MNDIKIYRLYQTMNIDLNKSLQTIYLEESIRVCAYYNIYLPKSNVILLQCIKEIGYEILIGFIPENDFDIDKLIYEKLKIKAKEVYVKKQKCN